MILYRHEGRWSTQRLEFDDQVKPFTAGRQFLKSTQPAGHRKIVWADRGVEIKYVKTAPCDVFREGIVDIDVDFPRGQRQEILVVVVFLHWNLHKAHDNLLGDVRIGILGKQHLGQPIHGVGTAWLQVGQSPLDFQCLRVAVDVTVVRHHFHRIACVRQVVGGCFRVRQADLTSGLVDSQFAFVRCEGALTVHEEVIRQHIAQIDVCG